jgi:hypothetical protein
MCEKLIDPFEHDSVDKIQTRWRKVQRYLDDLVHETLAKTLLFRIAPAKRRRDDLLSHKLRRKVK